MNFDDEETIQVKKYFQTNNISGFQVIWESSIFDSVARF